MARSQKRQIENYTHPDQKRVNNPPVGLVTAETDRDARKKTYAYDPHLDPSLQWAGKVERTSFDIPTVSLHVHERVDPRSIIEAVKKKNGEDFVQGSFFSLLGENPPLREAIDFYKHKHDWSNRLIAGDSLLVMNSLLEKEGMSGKVQMVYIDPPYGIRYGSNFQPFVNNREVRDGKDEDLTAEPEMVKAFRDTWELGIHSYLSYLRDRLLLARELLHESGSVFVQISDENVHHVRAVLDEIFGPAGFVGQICFQKTTGQSSLTLSSVFDYLIWYTKDKHKIKFRQLYKRKFPGDEGATEYNKVELADGSIRQATTAELEDFTLLPRDARLFSTYSLFSAGEGKDQLRRFSWENNGKKITIDCPRGYHFKTGNDISKLEKLANLNRLMPTSGQRILKRYLDDFAWTPFSNLWTDTRGEPGMVYVVQTASKVIQRCLLMTTDPGDLVVDITCGSGTTAVSAEQWGRRWITCDTSRVALTLAKQRLMTSVFDYYELAHEVEGVDSGFRYKTVPHVTIKSIVNNDPPDVETLYDQPAVDRRRVRVTGPFTVEAVPAPIVRPFDEVEGDNLPADESIARSGETQRQSDWRDELLKTGIRGKGGQRIEFSRVEPLPGTRWLQADAETKEPTPQRVVVSFGPEYAQRWPGESGRWDKWIFCLRAARIAADQERA
jgi:adenine-specific DNA-methyltransferase